MTFFEILIALLLAAVVLLQLSSRLGLPYPAMLAVAGVLVGFIPGAPVIGLEPDTVLALFLAPVLLDAAFDFPTGAAGRLWRPLVVLAVGAVLLTAGTVAWIGWAVAGLPIAAALVLGAIVAPPDAAAATAVLGSVSLPRRTVGVLKGESLFNDATALLLFTGALAAHSGGLTGSVALELTVAIPGGILLGVVLGLVMGRVSHFVAGTLGGNILQFLNAFFVWIVAEHLHLSAVLAVVACGMTVARSPGAAGAPRMRVHSFAVWSTVVFLLNVFAFLLMGSQAHAIVARLSTERLWEALRFASLVIVAVIVVRLTVVMVWNRLSARFRWVRGDLPAATVGQGIAVGWSGMRGLITLATAFALPADFPQRDLVVLTAFAVVLATLVAQGLTLAPLIRFLGLDKLDDTQRELNDAHRILAETALEQLEGKTGAPADNLRELYGLKGRAEADPDAASQLDEYHDLGLKVIAAQRARLQQLLDEEQLGVEEHALIQEEIDWRELTLLPESERQIDEV